MLDAPRVGETEGRWLTSPTARMGASSVVLRNTVRLMLSLGAVDLCLLPLPLSLQTFINATYLSDRSGTFSSGSVSLCSAHTLNPWPFPYLLVQRDKDSERQCSG